MSVEFSFDRLKNIADEFRVQIAPKNDTEARVYEALSTKNWGASGTLMQEIAHDSMDREKYSMIMDLIWDALSGPGKTWRQIYKGLVLLDFLIRNGSENVVENCRDHLHQIRQLNNYSFREPDGEKGSGVRDHSKIITDLLSSNDRLRDERKKARSLREKFVGIGSSGRMEGFGSIQHDSLVSQAFSSANEYTGSASPNRRDERWESGRSGPRPSPYGDRDRDSRDSRFNDDGRGHEGYHNNNNDNNDEFHDGETDNRRQFSNEYEDEHGSEASSSSSSAKQEKKKKTSSSSSSKKNSAISVTIKDEDSSTVSVAKPAVVVDLMGMNSPKASSSSSSSSASSLLFGGASESVDFGSFASNPSLSSFSSSNAFPIATAVPLTNNNFNNNFNNNSSSQFANTPINAFPVTITDTAVKPRTGNFNAASSSVFPTSMTFPTPSSSSSSLFADTTSSSSTFNSFPSNGSVMSSMPAHMMSNNNSNSTMMMNNNFSNSNNAMSFNHQTNVNNNNNMMMMNNGGFQQQQQRPTMMMMMSSNNNNNNTTPMNMMSSSGSNQSSFKGPSSSSSSRPVDFKSSPIKPINNNNNSEGFGEFQSSDSNNKSGDTWNDFGGIINLNSLKTNVDETKQFKKQEMEEAWRTEAAFAGLDRMNISSGGGSSGSGKTVGSSANNNMNMNTMMGSNNSFLSSSSSSSSQMGMQQQQQARQLQGKPKEIQVDSSWGFDIR